MKKLVILIFLLIYSKNILADQNNHSFADIIEPLLPSVVSIASTTIVSENQGLPEGFPQFPEGSPFEEFFKDYFDQQQRNTPKSRPLVGLGSGFIIDSEGVVVTNNHVIEGADEITVIMENGKEFEAEVMGADPKADIAVIKFDPAGEVLKSVEWGDSEKARVGDSVIAIGNPLGFGGTVTTGILSAIARDIGNGYVKFMQTDASINKGNSGGPLFNIEGEVIGINQSIVSQTGGSIGLGFAVPSNSAKKIVSQLREFGRTKRGWLGVQIQEVTEEITESLGLIENKGAFIASVQEDSPAYRAGIEAGDVILKFNNVEIQSYRDLPRIVAETDVGSNVLIKIWRKNNTIDINVKLGELDEPIISSSAEKISKESKEIKEIGVTVRDLTEDDYTKFKLDENIKGVFVIKIISDNTSLNAGDIITEVNRDKIDNIINFEEYILKIKETGRSSILLKVIRDNETIWVTLKYL